MRLRHDRSRSMYAKHKTKMKTCTRPAKYGMTLYHPRILLCTSRPHSMSIPFSGIILWRVAVVVVVRVPSAESDMSQSTIGPGETFSSTIFHRQGGMLVVGR